MKLPTLSKLVLLGFATANLASAAPSGLPDYVTPSKEILKTFGESGFAVERRVPADLPSRLGAAHVSGKYSFTEKPFLIEGCEDLLAMGFRGVKLWFTKIREAYPYHSEWNLPAGYTLTDLARHPYFEQTFQMPFLVFALEVQPVEGHRPPKGHALDPASDFSQDEKEIYDLSAYLLIKFKDRPVTFILQNWEGDWMLRGGAKDQWDAGEYPDLERRAQAFIRWLQARQRGVDRARAEHPDSQCKVLHAVEVNQVLATWKGVPTLTSHVLPHAKTDLVSWSCYDGMRNDKRSAAQTAIGLWQGIETIRHFARAAHDGADVPVFIGEIGIPEQKNFREEEIRAIWDGAFSTLFAMNVPYIFQWQLYDNEIKQGAPHGKDRDRYMAEELNGFWLRKPDGSLSPSGEYLTRLLQLSSGSSKAQ